MDDATAALGPLPEELPSRVAPFLLRPLRRACPQR